VQAGRVVRQLMTEGLVLAVAGGALGLLLAYWAMRVLLAFAGQTLPRAESIGFDARRPVHRRALAGPPLLFGVVPALRATMGSTFNALKEARTATAGHSRHRLLGSLVVARFALALMLSVDAAARQKLRASAQHRSGIPRRARHPGDDP
jgi:hypothetical protein